MSTGDDLVRIAVAPDELVAHLWKGVLEDSGVKCLLKNTDYLSVMSGGLAAPYSIQVFVLRRDAEKARRVLGLEREVAG